MSGKGPDSQHFIKNDIPAAQLEEVKMYLESVISKAREELEAQERKLLDLETGEGQRKFERDMKLWKFDADEIEMIRKDALNPATYQKNIEYYTKVIARITDVIKDFESNKFNRAVAFLVYYAGLREAYWALPLLDNAEERMRAEQEQIKKYVSFLQ